MKRSWLRVLFANMSKPITLTILATALICTALESSHGQALPATPDSVPLRVKVTGATCSGSDRLVTVANHSSETIWVASLGSTDTAAPDPNPTCSSDSQCNANEFCDSLVVPPQCRSVPLNGQITYDPDSSKCSSNESCTRDEGFPICYTGTGKCGTLPKNGNGFQLANNATQQICVPTTWGGRLWARTQCSFNAADNTLCGGSCQGQAANLNATCATSADCRNECVGGTNAGKACTIGSDCPGVCQGGSNNGKACTTGAECPDEGKNLGSCNFGYCGTAFCASGTSCCATGSCTGARLTCSGGANSGDVCASAADCPKACAGGPDNGRQCSGAADCPGVCLNGPKAGEQCSASSDCGSGFQCNTGSCINSGVCTANTYSLYCAAAGSAPATLAELTLAAPGVCSGGSKGGGPCGPACTAGGGTCKQPTAVEAKSDFFDVQVGIDGANLPVVVTPMSGSYQVTGDLLGLDTLAKSSCTTSGDCAANTAPYNQQCFSPTSNPKLFGPVGGKCAAACTSDRKLHQGAIQQVLQIALTL